MQVLADKGGTCYKHQHASGGAHDMGATIRRGAPATPQLPTGSLLAGWGGGTGQRALDSRPAERPHTA